MRKHPSYFARRVGAILADPPLEFQTVISPGALVTFFKLPDHTPLLRDMGTTVPGAVSMPKVSVLLPIFVVASTLTTCEMVSYSATVIFTGGSLLTVIGAVRETPL